MQEKRLQMALFLRKNWVKIFGVVLLLVFFAAKIQTFDLSYVNRDEPLYSWQSLAIYHNPELLFTEELNYPYSAIIPALAAPLNAFFEPHIPVRIIVFLFSILALVFTYLIGKKIFSRNAGLAAMLLLILSPCFFYFSTKSMFDVPLAALGTVLIYLLLTLNKRRAGLIPILLFVMYLIKPTSLVVLPPIVVFLLVRFREKIGIKHIILAAAATLLLIYVGFLLSPYSLWMSLEIPVPKATEVSQFSFASTMVVRFSWKIAGIAMSIFALIAAIKLRKRVTKETGLLLLWIFLTALPFIVFRKGADRLYLLAVPAFAVIGGHGMAWLANKKRYLALIATVALIFGLVLVSERYYWSYYRLDSRFGITNEKLSELGSWLEENVAEEDKVIILSYEFFMRAIRVTAEDVLQEPREQMVVNPDKEEFERIISESSINHFLVLDSSLVLDNRSGHEEIWLYLQETDWESYLQELGFEKQEEFRKQEIHRGIPEDYLVYKKAKD